MQEEKEGTHDQAKLARDAHSDDQVAHSDAHQVAHPDAHPDVHQVAHPDAHHVARPDAHHVAHSHAQQHDLLPSGREWFQILNIKGRIKKSFEYFSSTTDKIVPKPTPTSSS